MGIEDNRAECIRAVVYSGGFCRGASPGSDSGYFGEDIAGEEGLSEDHDCAWLYWCPGLPPERWQEECRLVEERFSLFEALPLDPARSIA